MPGGVGFRVGAADEPAAPSEQGGRRDPDRPVGVARGAPASAPRHSPDDGRHLVQRQSDRADRRGGDQVGRLALDIGGDLRQPRVEPHIGGREVRQAGLAYAIRGQRAQAAVDARDEPRQALALGRIERSDALCGLGRGQRRQLRPRPCQAPSREVHTVRNGELGE